MPCEIIHAGLKVKWDKVNSETLTGAYQLKGSNVWDSALTFTADMYKPGSHMCVSFTGPYKHFKLSKGGAILTDDEEAVEWFKQARFDGRHEVPLHHDDFKILGWNMYMTPEQAGRGLWKMMGLPEHNEDQLENPPYPDLSKYKIFTEANRDLLPEFPHVTCSGSKGINLHIL